jgi:hypothetical protein
MVVSRHLCDDSTGGFSGAECNPCNPAGGERFLGRYCLVEKTLDDRYLQKYDSAGDIEMKGNFSEVAVLVLSKLHWGRYRDGM